MIDVSGHLRETRRNSGYNDMTVPLAINCCGYQVCKTKNYIMDRPEGRVDYQIIYVYEGIGRFLLNGEIVSVPAGNILLFPPHKPQYYAYLPSENPTIYWIHFTGTNCDALLKKYQIQNCYVGKIVSLKILFQDIITELQLKNPLYEDLVINAFHKMLMIICRSHQQILMPNENNFSIDRLIIELNRNYMKKWTISSMADFCKVSDGYFSHIFKKHTGNSPIAFLNRLRIEKAKFLLSSNTMNISTVSVLVGFDDPLYFSRTFKKITGIPPQNFLHKTLETQTPEWWKNSKPQKLIKRDSGGSTTIFITLYTILFS